MDFKQWWIEQEFFGGDNCMEAAELAWDYFDEVISSALADVAINEPSEEELISLGRNFQDYEAGFNAAVKVIRRRLIGKETGNAQPPTN